ncbi:hypothetical protein Q4F19_16005 [Sphingomonas sp. BIUV-7]|uniref:Phage shock protein B n=1 Tax=Sphingomonas natans TaxID=3063330 RepID=A0ABT8YC23_9SPHN|nr:hypothetical protein [Sphingomonas sp. BIUV-7]MDO6415895.1 hypothetical protein [Sphingomonas sp. BIUV-7]
MIEFAPFLMIVAIVAIVCFTRLQRARLNASDAAAAPGKGSIETDRVLGEVRQLKDRIAVLERIVTDGDHTRGLALEREIEALRDAREGAK